MFRQEIEYIIPQFTTFRTEIKKAVVSPFVDLKINLFEAFAQMLGINLSMSEVKKGGSQKLICLLP